MKIHFKRCFIKQIGICLLSGLLSFSLLISQVEASGGETTRLRTTSSQVRYQCVMRAKPVNQLGQNFPPEAQRKLKKSPFLGSIVNF